MKRAHVEPESRTGVGFTLIELMVSLAVIGLLVAMTLPAIQQSRASARRMQCTSHLRQIGIAAHAYAESHGQLPYTHPGAGLLFSLLPYLEQSAEHARLEKLLSGSMADQMQAAQTAAKIGVYLCPEDVDATQAGASSYVVNRGLLDITNQQRAFVPDDGRKLSWRDITDGVSHTALCSERRAIPITTPGTPPDPRYGLWFVNSSVLGGISRDQVTAFANDCLQVSQTTPPSTPSGGVSYLSANAGYNHVGTPQSPACMSAGLLFSVPAVSRHAGGVHLLLADGSVKFAAITIDGVVWRALGSRNGNETESSSF